MQMKTSVNSKFLITCCKTAFLRFYFFLLHLSHIHFGVHNSMMFSENLYIVYFNEKSIIQRNHSEGEISEIEIYLTFVIIKLKDKLFVFHRKGSYITIASWSVFFRLCFASKCIASGHFQLQRVNILTFWSAQNSTWLTTRWRKWG